MIKGLESLSDLRLGFCGSDEQKERAYSIIEKELKVLSLLKKYSRFIKGWYADQVNWSYDEILIRIENTDRWNKEEKEDFKIIKEWLENDN